MYLNTAQDAVQLTARQIRSACNNPAAELQQLTLTDGEGLGDATALHACQGFLLRLWFLGFLMEVSPY